MTRASITLRKSHFSSMDCRVKPGNDDGLLARPHLSPHPEERALARVSKDGRERFFVCPWFETPRESAAPHHEGCYWLAHTIRAIHSTSPAASARSTWFG